MAALTSPFAITGDTSSVHTSASTTLGTRAWDALGNEYIYLQGIGSTVATDFVTYDENFLTTRLTTSNVGPIAVAMAAVVASSYGWYQVGGEATANTATVVDNAQLYASATAGRADDDASVGPNARLNGVTARATSATVQLDNPYMGLVGDPLSETKYLASSITYDANTTPALITGFAWPVVAGGVYEFDVDLSTTMTTNAGLTIAFKLTTATLTSIRYTTEASTASDNTTAVSTYGTTTTDLTEPFNSKTAAYTRVRLRGVMVINAAGTFSWYGCQETSGTGGDVTILLLNSTATLRRIA